MAKRVPEKSAVIESVFYVVKVGGEMVIGWDKKSRHQKLNKFQAVWGGHLIVRKSLALIGWQSFPLAIRDRFKGRGDFYSAQISAVMIGPTATKRFRLRWTLEARTCKKETEDIKNTREGCLRTELTSVHHCCAVFSDMLDQAFISS